MIYLSYVTLHIKIRLYKLLYCKLIKLSVLFTLLIRLSHRPQGIWKKHSFLRVQLVKIENEQNNFSQGIPCYRSKA